MKTSGNNSLTKKISSVAFALLLGLSAVSVARAAGDRDNRYVDVGATRYDVHNNSTGPYIRVLGDKFYLSADNNDKTVVVDGVTYSVHHHGD